MKNLKRKIVVILILIIGFGFTCYAEGSMKTATNVKSGKPRNSGIALDIHNDDAVAVEAYLNAGHTPGEDISTNDNAFQTLLDYAVEYKSYSALEVLAKKAGKDIDKYSTIPIGDKSWVRTPLIYAASEGELEAVKILVKYGAALNLTDWYVPISMNEKEPLYTALHHACKGAFYDIAEFLVQSKANLNLKTADGETPLIVTIKSYPGINEKDPLIQELTKIVDLLIKNKADLNLDCLPVNVKFVTIELPEGAPSNVGSKIPARGGYYEAIHFAAQVGFVDAARLLLDAGISVERTSKEFPNPPLLIAAQYKQTKMAEFLVSRNAKIEAVDSVGYTPIMWATRTLNYDLVNFLISKKANVNKLGPDGMSSLMWATNQNQQTDENDILKVMTLLLDNGADINLKAKTGYQSTALLWACGYGVASEKTGKAELLLSRGANPNLTDKDGNTALIKAASKGYTAIGELLINKKANIEAKNKAGQTALMLAASSKTVALGAYSDYGGFVKMLIKHGANINAETNKKQTALSLTKENGNTQIVTILQSSGGTVNKNEVIVDKSKELVGVWVGDNGVQKTTWTFNADKTWKCNTDASEQLLKNYETSMRKQVNQAIKQQAAAMGTSGTYSFKGDTTLVLSMMRVVGYEIRDGKLNINGQTFIRKK